MSDEEKHDETPGKARFGRRVRHQKSGGSNNELDHSVEAGAFVDAPSSQQPKKPKVRIGPKNRRAEAPETGDSASSKASPPGKARDGSRSGNQKPGGGADRRPQGRDRKDPSPPGRQVNSAGPAPMQPSNPADMSGGVRRKRRRRKGRRPDENPNPEPAAVRPDRLQHAVQMSIFGTQVLPPVQDDMDEVPSGIFETSDLTDSDSDSDLDNGSDFESGLDVDPSTNDGASSLSSIVDGASSHPESRSSRERKRRKKRRDRQELPPVDRNTGYWWAEQWVRSFEMLFPSNASRSRLAKGRTYARRGQVLELEVGPNGVLARVQGSRPRPYQVRLELNRLRRETWGRILHQLVGKATFLAQLLEGHLPPEIEEVFFSAGARLFPHGDVDIRVRCNCPDPVVPCKHVAALNYSLADALQRDPFLLFAMRGKSRDQFLQDLREMRGRDNRVSAPLAHVDEDVSDFWRMGRLADSALRPTGWSMGNDPARLLQSLGEPQLDGIREGLFLPMLEATYRQVAESMRRLPKDA